MSFQSMPVTSRTRDRATYASMSAEVIDGCSLSWAQGRRGLCSASAFHSITPDYERRTASGSQLLRRRKAGRLPRPAFNCQTFENADCTAGAPLTSLPPHPSVIPNEEGPRMFVDAAASSSEVVVSNTFFQRLLLSAQAGFQELEPLKARNV